MDPNHNNKFLKDWLAIQTLILMNNIEVHYYQYAILSTECQQNEQNRSLEKYNTKSLAKQLHALMC